MDNTVKFNFKGKDYELGFNRKTATMLQNLGFKKDEMEDKSFTMVPMLVHASFAMNHKGIKVQEMDEIYYEYIHKDDKPKFLAALLKSYMLTQTTLFGGDEKEDENKDFIKLDIE